MSTKQKTENWCIMAEGRYRQNYENEYHQLDDINSYVELIPNLESDFEVERTVTQKISSRVCLKTVVITVVFVAVVGFVTMTVLYIQERNKRENENDGETDGQNQKIVVCPKEPFQGMNYTTAGKTGIQGRQFLVCFTDNLDMASDQAKTIYILSDEDFEFKVISKFSKQLFNEVVTSRINLRELSVTSAISLSDFKIEEKALLIETSRDVSVIIIDNFIHTSDSTSILPIKSTSNSYVISTPRAFSKITGPQFAIASTRNGTRIKIHFHFDPDLPKKVNGKTYQNGSVMQLVLNELETYEIYHRVDMSGTFIDSTSPVAVFSGSYCTEIGFKNSTDFGGCSKLDEQLPPIDRLDKMYIVPPNYNRMGTILKIVSPFQTRLTYKIGNKQTEKILQPRGYFEITFSDKEVVVINSEKPVLVTSFATGSSNTGNPYMITVPGIRQYTDKYIVMVPGDFRENYVTIIVEEKSLITLMLNETKIIHYLNDGKFYTTVTFWNINFVVVILQVQGGFLRVESTNKAAFGLIVYGHRKRDGHGFAGKAVLPDVCVPSN